MTLLWVAAGGALGASLRYLMGGLVTVPQDFPWTTLMVNVAGSLLIGVCWGLGQGQEWFMQWGRAFLVVGVLGGFTTFSSFSFETVLLIESGRLPSALGYVMLSVVFCVLFAWVGQRLAA